MNTLWHFPLERYRQRYTEFLQDWEREAFSHFFDVRTVIPGGQNVLLDVISGEVLDRRQRPIWAMQQVAEFLQSANSPDPGRIWISDFFHPGLEALPYAGIRSNISTFCWAQSFDRHDFTRKMVDWMRPWEVMALEIYSNVFVACDELADLIISAIPALEPKIRVAGGLPFDSVAVGKAIIHEELEMFDVVYSSRMDREKRPGIFLNLVERWSHKYKFVISTGWSELRGSAHQEIERALRLEQEGKLQIFRNQTKGRYYNLLAHSRLQFNSALQDWVSYTLLEALVFGCQVLYPAYRAFPSVLHHSTPNLYKDMEDASRKLDTLLSSDTLFPHTADILEASDAVLPKIARTI